MDDALGNFANGAALVGDGIIKAIGKPQDLEAADAEIIDTTDGVAVPGLIDTYIGIPVYVSIVWGWEPT
ncbi:hypothetical protein IW140_006633, partial [Coemansia sp. RSA 1813]